MPATLSRTARSSVYADAIRAELARTGHLGTDWRHAEAWMRLECGTLDGLSRARFADEIAVAVECIGAAGIAESEALARSYGL